MCRSHFFYLIYGIILKDKIEEGFMELGDLINIYREYQIKIEKLWRSL